MVTKERNTMSWFSVLTLSTLEKNLTTKKIMTNGHKKIQKKVSIRVMNRNKLKSEIESKTTKTITISWNNMKTTKITTNRGQSFTEKKVSKSWMKNMGLTIITCISFTKQRKTKTNIMHTAKGTTNDTGIQKTTMLIILSRWPSELGSLSRR